MSGSNERRYPPASKYGLRRLPSTVLPAMFFSPTAPRPCMQLITTEINLGHVLA